MHEIQEIPPAKKPKILFVDDEEALMLTYKTVLERTKNYEVTGTTSSVKARELLKATAYDLLITDITMPIVSGHELAALAKAQNRATKVVGISGYLTPGDGPNKFDRFVSKPVGVAQFLSVVAEVLHPPEKPVL